MPLPPIIRRAVPARPLVLAVIAAAAVAVAASCGNPFAVTASLKDFTDTLSVYGLTEAPIVGPSAINTYQGKPVPTQPSTNYDIVFDIHPDSTGAMAAWALPPRLVGTFGSTGLIKDTTRAFEDIKQAPVNGYDDSTAVRIRPGDVLLLQAQSYVCAGAVLQQRLYIYSKIVIDSINLAPFDPNTNPNGSTIYLRITVDPNCGFISFADGLPPN